MTYTHLSILDREKIQEGLWQKKSVRAIARELERPHSAVSREIRKNLPPEIRKYTPRLAHERALLNRKNRGRKDRLKNAHIRAYVVTHLKLKWSPEQIAGRMKRDTGETISHEAIYQYVYAQCRNGSPEVRSGREDLRVYLRRRRKRRYPKGVRKGQRVFKSLGNSIDERPLVANERKRIGDWEGDTVESCNHKPGVNTLVERKTGYLFVTKLKNKTSSATINVVRRRMSVLPKKARRTLTLDNGPENRDWQGMQEDTNLSVFFAHPYHSWERGTNENTNGLIRDYFPKKTDFTSISDEEIQKVEYDLNTRPRKRLNWSTPLEALSGALKG
jgi:transposase, IS30 family